MNNGDRLLLASTCVSIMWNMSAPLPTSRLGILMSTVEPGNLLGPLFMAWNHITRRREKMEMKGKKNQYIEKHVQILNVLHCLCQQYLKGEIKRLKVTLHVFQLDEARGVDVVPVHKGARCHHTAGKRQCSAEIERWSIHVNYLLKWQHKSINKKFTNKNNLKK